MDEITVYLFSIIFWFIQVKASCHLLKWTRIQKIKYISFISYLFIFKFFKKNKKF